MENTKNKFSDLLQAVRKHNLGVLASALEEECNERGHKPSNVNPAECDCGFMRYEE